MSPAPRVYADSSVFGGAFDEEFAVASTKLFSLVRDAAFHLVTSRVVDAELSDAPAAVKALCDEMLALAEIVEVTAEATRLQRAYLEHGVVGPASAIDALHVALATVSHCTIIVSWNFKRMVHFQKIPRYNAVNVLNGYPVILIHSPPEVLLDEDEDQDV